MKHLVINADDFGINAGVNRSILRAYRLGLLKSASILADGPMFEEVARLVIENPGLDIGVHMALRGGPRVSLAFFLRGEMTLREIRRDWRAQIERVLSRGLIPSHLNTHQHVHLFPPLFRLALDLALEFNIPFLRVPSAAPMDALRQCVLDRRPRTLLLTPLLVSCGSLGRLAKTSGVRVADCTLGLLEAGAMGARRFGTILRSVPEGISELVLHLGEESAESRSGYSRGFRLDEPEALAAEAAHWVSALGLCVTSYRELAAARRAVLA